MVGRLYTGLFSAVKRIQIRNHYQRSRLGFCIPTTSSFHYEQRRCCMSAPHNRAGCAETSQTVAQRRWLSTRLAVSESMPDEDIPDRISKDSNLVLRCDDCFVHFHTEAALRLHNACAHKSDQQRLLELLYNYRSGLSHTHRVDSLTNAAVRAWEAQVANLGPMPSSSLRLKEKELSEIAENDPSGRSRDTSIEDIIEDPSERFKSEEDATKGLLLSRSDQRNVDAVKAFNENLNAYVHACCFSEKIPLAVETVEKSHQLNVDAQESGSVQAKQRHLPINRVDIFNWILLSLGHVNKKAERRKLTSAIIIDLTKRVLAVMSARQIEPNLDTIYATALIVGQRAQPLGASFDERVQRLADEVGFRDWITDRLQNDQSTRSLRTLFHGRPPQKHNNKLVRRVFRNILPPASNFEFTPETETYKEDNELLAALSTPAPSSNESTSTNLFGVFPDEETLKAKIARQREIEQSFESFQVKSVSPGKPSPGEKIFNLISEIWKARLAKKFKQFRNRYQDSVDESSAAPKITIGPFLDLLTTSEHVKIMHNELLELSYKLGPGYSDSKQALAIKLGEQVLERVKRKIMLDRRLDEEVERIYGRYARFRCSLCSAETSASESANLSQLNERELWNRLSERSFGQAWKADALLPVWPYAVTQKIGSALLKIMTESAVIFEKKNVCRVFGLGLNGKSINALLTKRAFLEVARHFQDNSRKELEIDQQLVALVTGHADTQVPTKEHLPFCPSVLPMLVPPVPWTSVHYGGYLTTPGELVRMKGDYPQQMREELHKPENQQQLLGVFDSLNQLAAVPWRINKKVLDLMLSIFNGEGNPKLGLPPPEPLWGKTVDEVSPIELRNKATCQRAYMAATSQRARKLASMRKLQNERCTVLYKLSVANSFRDETFWFPFNMDFRGRVYPSPSSFNHMGNDLSRGILLFAVGRPLGGPQEPLGFSGLDWLKIHCINLTGLKKKDRLDARLAYAEEVMADILASAEDPLKNTWWQNDEDPWQTLAACFEIRNALECPNPEQYVCHLPIHQDGQCNGLQHYAAIGRDQKGAEQVSVANVAVPGDVYQEVRDIVERRRVEDAAKGHKVAKSLDGLVSRRVLKQSVMTQVYGVTMYGAKEQIKRKLKELQADGKTPKGFDVLAASQYLADLTFQSVGDLFANSVKIRDWLLNVAELVARDLEVPMRWTTPLGLPVVQPYVRRRTSATASKKKPDEKKAAKTRQPDDAEGSDEESDAKAKSKGKRRKKKNTQKQPAVISKEFADKVAVRPFDERPNPAKQKTAFAPNFIHSLDSTHMMLTALHCQRKGVMFASIHDCFWTHFCSVSTMNEICRQQFYALHSQPLLTEFGDSVKTAFFDEDSGNKQKLSAAFTW